MLCYPGANVCFRGFRTYAGGHEGACAYALGGQRREMGVFVRSYQSCCRRIQAQGWGLPHSCQVREPKCKRCLAGTVCETLKTDK